MVQTTDPLQKYFEANNMTTLFGEVRSSSTFCFDECLDSSCDLRRNRQGACRDAFEGVLLEFGKNPEFIKKLVATKTLRVVDFGSGYLFQTFVIVRKLIDKILQLPQFKDEKLNLVVDVIDPGYLQVDQFRDSFECFKRYFISQYQKHSQINFTLNVLTDGNNISEINFNNCALIFTCADFERFMLHERSDVIIKLPEELLKKFYDSMQVGSTFWFCTLNKFGFINKEKKHIGGPVVFFGTIEKLANTSWESYIQQKNVVILPFFRPKYFAPFSPDNSGITRVPFAYNLDKL